MALIVLLFFAVSCSGARLQHPLAVQHKRERTNKYGSVPLRELGLDIETYQKPKTKGCWFLSVLEGLRFKKHVAKWFTSRPPLIRVEEVEGKGDDNTYTWSTGRGSKTRSGTFAAWGVERGLWQQVLESIFVQHWNLNPSKAKEFQHRIQSRLGQGENRMDDIQAFLRLVDPGITVTQDVLYIRHSLTLEDVDDFIQKQQSKTGPGVAIAWTLDKGGTHAIACTTDPYKSGNRYLTETYNQQKAYEDEYKITGDTCKSLNLRQVICDSVWAYQVSGLQ